MTQCDCILWAETDFLQHMLGNGHNTNCEHFKPNEGAVRLLKELIEGIHEWATEGAAPDSLWEVVRKATWIIEGRFLPQNGRDPV